MRIVREEKKKINPLDEIPEKICEDIVNSKGSYELRHCHLCRIGPPGIGHYLANKIKDALNLLGLNPNKEVNYEVGKGIFVSSKGVSAIKAEYTSLRS